MLMSEMMMKPSRISLKMVCSLRSQVSFGLPRTANALLMNGYMGYTKALTDYLIDYTNQSPVVQAQIGSPDVNVVNGFQFEPEDDAEKITEAKEYLANLSISDKAALCQQMIRTMYADNPEQLEAMSSLGETELAGMLDQYLANDMLDDESLLMLYDSYISPGSYDDNMNSLWLGQSGCPFHS